MKAVSMLLTMTVAILWWSSVYAEASCNFPCDAGEGEHHLYVKPSTANVATDSTALTPRDHYLGVDAVRWFINGKSNFLTDKMGSGTIKISIGNEKYDVGLATYQLQNGERTAPVFDAPLLPNRLYVGGAISLQSYVRVIKNDTDMGGLLRDMANASLGVVSGAVTAASAAGPNAVLLAAGKSLVGGVQTILKAGSRATDIFDESGMAKTFNARDFKGKENFILLHRGSNLDLTKLDIAKDTSGNVSVNYNNTPLEDGSWILLRVRRELVYGSPRPWEDEARTVRVAIDSLFDNWMLGGITQAKVKEQLQPSAQVSNPTLGDRLLTVVTLIRNDFVLTEHEASTEAVQLRRLLMIAQKAANDNNPESYSTQRDSLEKELLSSQIPRKPIQNLFNEESGRLASLREFQNPTVPAPNKSPFMSFQSSSSKADFWKTKAAIAALKGKDWWPARKEQKK